ncbi:hypothetical protein E2320_008789 [Naja naja]|nr:hypothetical protein E2320_008789 [Naja naja]
MEDQVVMALTTKALFLVKVIHVVHQTIKLAHSQKEDMTRIVVAQIMVLKEVPSEVVKNGMMVETQGVCQTEGHLIQISMMTLIEQMNFVKTSIQTSDLGIVYVNLREEEVHLKKRNGEEVVQALLSFLITGNSMKEIVGVQTVDLLAHGMDEELQMSDSLMIQRKHDIEEEEMKTLGEVHLQGMKVEDQEEETVFLDLMILCQKKILTHQRKMQGEETTVVEEEVGVTQEEDEKVFFPLQMNFLILKAEWMEIENQVPVKIILLTMDILLQIENVPPPCKEWIWPHYHLANDLGMMDQEPLITEKWKCKLDIQRREERDEENQAFHRGCQSLEDPVLWMESIMMDIIEKNLEDLQETILLEEEEVGVTGEEEVT